jgi:hypothetical protein
MHLFAAMGLSPTLPTGEYPCGKGKVCVIRDEPKNFVLHTKGDETYFAVIRKAFEAAPGAGRLVTKNSFYLERGHYVIAAVVDEGLSTEPLTLKGSFIDLFDPELPVLREKTVRPGEQAFLYDLAKINDADRPSVLCGASRIYDEEYAEGRYSFVAKSPAETDNVTRLRLPKKPETLTVKGAASTYTWDEASHTCLLKFENDPDGVPVKIEY